ncbi:hypothetical protein C8039_07770 [Halogeometricum sp. wsp3]|nr:hypothetical protein C8039_07770 [Halogeometricum sp. wsp3]
MYVWIHFNECRSYEKLSPTTSRPVGNEIRYQLKLTRPLVRNDAGEFEPTSWEDALDYVAERLSEIQDEHGVDTVGCLASSNLRQNLQSHTLMNGPMVVSENHGPDSEENRDEN